MLDRSYKQDPYTLVMLTLDAPARAAAVPATVVSSTSPTTQRSNFEVMQK